MHLDINPNTTLLPRHPQALFVALLVTHPLQGAIMTVSPSPTRDKTQDHPLQHSGAVWCSLVQLGEHCLCFFNQSTTFCPDVLRVDAVSSHDDLSQNGLT